MLLFYYIPVYGLVLCGLRHASAAPATTDRKAGATFLFFPPAGNNRIFAFNCFSEQTLRQSVRDALAISLLHCVDIALANDRDAGARRSFRS
ncbi:MAG: hypothetical protein ACLUZX_12195 [Subdoligranulum sp.]